jgi:hypothetical protein
MLISSFIFHLRGFAPKRTEGAQARGIVAEPPAKRQRREAGDGADSPTRAEAKPPRSGSPKNYFYSSDRSNANINI